MTTQTAKCRRCCAVVSSLSSGVGQSINSPPPTKNLPVRSAKGMQLLINGSWLRMAGSSNFNNWPSRRPKPKNTIQSGRPRFNNSCRQTACRLNILAAFLHFFYPSPKPI